MLDLRSIHWVIVGGESGNGARRMNPDWALSLLQQCEAAGVRYFFKQQGTVWARESGSPDDHGGDLAYVPPRLRVREFPR